MMNARRRVAGVALVISGVTMSMVVAPRSAEAATCSGTACTGKDPQDAGCGSAASVVASQTDSGVGTYMTLKYGTACHAWWVRISIPPYKPSDEDGFTGCQMASVFGIRAVLYTQTNGGGHIPWQTYKNYATSMKICPKNYTDPGVGWTLMVRGGSDIRARGCIQAYDGKVWKDAGCRSDLWYTKA